jgi:SAM-dependent methyltransferase
MHDMKESIDWADRIFVQHAKVYQPVLECGLITAPSEVRAVDKIFGRFGADGDNDQFRLLDVSCGIGRHSINFAKLGYQVVGYDPSSTFLRRAKQLSREANLDEKKIRFYQGRLPDISKVLLRENNEKSFDGIIMMDTILGYSGKIGDDVRLFSELNRLASPRGLLVVENFNREYTLRHHASFWKESFPPNLERIITFNSKKPTA